VPMIITEPAVGYGAGLGLVFFHRKEPGSGGAGGETGERSVAPPSVSAILGGATENGTKFGGAGHLGIWRNDTLRFTGAIAAMSVNVKFYGAGQFPRLADGVEYNIDGWVAFSQLIWRWKGTNFWIGPQVIYLDATTGLQNPPPQPVFANLDGDVTNSGAGIVVSYDGRDNIFTPTRGVQSEWYVRKHWGEFANDDFDYKELDAKNRWYFDPGPRWVLGWRLDGTFTDGDVPFYALPYIKQRGIPSARYQGDAVVTTEIETRYDIDGRWFGVAFAGVGRAADSTGDLGSADNRWAGGVGARYLVARALGLQMGIDIAKGPEEWAFYIQFGSGWAF
jgi:hypothetical protein